MLDAAKNWGEKEWEKYSNELLSTHYAMNGGSYQRIPDKGGDCGLEGVTDCGCAYQCYADQESKTNEERTKKQKKKIGDDLRKLEKHKEFWTQYFGTRKIRRWTLMIPNMDDKEVVQYAKKKARDLKKKAMPFIADDFDAFVKTADDYPAAKLIARNPYLPKAKTIAVSPAEIAAFKQKEAKFIQLIDTKLDKVPSLGAAERISLREELLVYYLHSSNYLESLRQKFPAQWEEIDTLIDTLGKSISSEGLLDTRKPATRLTETRIDFVTTLKENQKYLGENERVQISWGTLSKWLGECSLDFKEVSDAGNPP